MSNVTQNNNKINKAFARSLANIDKAIQNGMEKLLDWGMNECLNKHDSRHRHHIDWGDTYGWMLYHNGSEVKRYVRAKAENNANANSALDSIASSLQGNGWRGVILAGMQPRRYFVIREEIKFMRHAILEMKAEDFNKYFKQV